MRKRLLSLAPAGLVLALLAGCSGGPDRDEAGATPDGTAPLVPVAEVDLVDLWRVGGAEGEAENTWLRLDTREFQLWRDCGIISGSWRVQGDLLLAGVYSASGDCATASIPEVAWLDSVVRYAATTSGVDLLDQAGQIVASLTVDGAPEPRADLAAFYAEPPEVTDETRAWFVEPAPVPDGLTPVAAGDLVARWIPVGPAGTTEAHVEFTEDGRWTGSDGCNGGAGRWAAGDRGAFLATSGASTLIACDGAAVPNWVAQATTAGLDQQELVLLSADGAELGRLIRS